MTDKEKYIKYLELKPQLDSGQINKTDAGIKLGFGNVKRPDDKLRKWLKKYENKTDEITHHVVHHMPKEDQTKEQLPTTATTDIMHHYFKNNENVEALMEIIEKHKNNKHQDQNIKEDMEVLDVNLSSEYRRIKNSQRSIRVNPELWKDWEATLKKNHNLEDLPQSQLLNLSLMWAIEKINNQN